MDIQPHFSYKEAVRSALALVWNNFSTFFYLALIWWIAWIMVLLLGYGLVASFQSSNSAAFSVTYYAFYFFMHFCEPYIQYQLLCLGLSAHKKESLTVRKAFSYSFKNFLYFFAARLLLSLEIFIGMIMLIIPGIYIGLKHYFAGYSLLENPKTTLSKDSAFSSTLTIGVKWRLLFVYYTQMCALLISFLTGLLSILMPPLMIVSVVLGAIAILVDLELFKQLKNIRSSAINKN